MTQRVSASALVRRAIHLMARLIPAIAIAAIWLEGPLTLGLGGTQIVLLALTVAVGTLTVVPGRATRLQGSIHLVVFAAFIFLAMFP
jgi:Ca2+:H+ antiporter